MCINIHQRDVYKRQAIDTALEMSTELREIYDNNEKIKKVIDTAKWLEGMIRQDSIHAAGIVISSEELYNYTPIQKESGEDIVTQYEMEHIPVSYTHLDVYKRQEFRSSL